MKKIKFLHICASGKLYQRSLTMGGSTTVQLVSTLTRLDLSSKENMLLFVGGETVDSKLVKLETSRTAILLPTVTVL